LLVLDAGTLELKRSFSLPDVAKGDSWIVADRKTDTITIVSEADEQYGKPFLVLDRNSGEVRDRRDIDAGNVVLVPDASRLLLSFFRRRSELMSYDLGSLSIQAEVPAPPNVDRMAFVEKTNEVLLVVPTQSQIARFDGSSLKPKGAINAMFGVRALAIDAERNLLICGSLATGEIEFMNVTSEKSLSRVYLGPWLRTIQVDSPRGIAYVSSNGALYEFKYGDLN
jgi:hypothetical protein